MSTPKLAVTDLLTLPHANVSIPRLGFGVYLSRNKQCITSCLNAFEAGYRHIDTAQYYGNEQEVGQALRESGLKRSQVFITTKIFSSKGSIDKSYESVLESVHRLCGEDGAVDLFLIHSPNAGKAARQELWLALEKLYDAGKTRSIGVSNYGIGHIEEMKEYARTWPPAVNQIELHPWCQQREIDDYCQKHGIVVEAYSPLVRNQRANDPTLITIAQKHNKSTAQILIRYSLQKNWVPLPKSDTPSRIVANADVYDLELTEDEMKQLDDQDKGGSKGAIVQAVTNTV